MECEKKVKAVWWARASTPTITLCACACVRVNLPIISHRCAFVLWVYLCGLWSDRAKFCFVFFFSFMRVLNFLFLFLQSRATTLNNTKLISYTYYFLGLFHFAYDCFMIVRSQHLSTWERNEIKIWHRKREFE